jgi:hypothetical protein
MLLHITQLLTRWLLLPLLLLLPFVLLLPLLLLPLRTLHVAMSSRLAASLIDL